jgi:hypothetical protein
MVSGAGILFLLERQKHEFSHNRIGEFQIEQQAVMRHVINILPLAMISKAGGGFHEMRRLHACHHRRHIIHAIAKRDGRTRG